MKFHEDVIFKNNGQIYGQELMAIMKIEGRIVEVHQTEYSIIDPKMYKPDLVFELEDRIIIVEFQSTYIDINDKRRFRFYTALFDQIKNKSKKDIEVHVLSTVEGEGIKCYRINPDSTFPIYVHSLKDYDGDEFLNRMNAKIGNNSEFTERELLLISLLCFMKSDNDMKLNILNSAVTITNIPNLDKEIGQFVKGVVLMLCDKFVKDESLNTRISNLVGGNMKIVEDYAQRVAERKVDEKLTERNEEIVRNMDEKGIKKEDIADLAMVSPEFVEKTLAK